MIPNMPTTPAPARKARPIEDSLLTNIQSLLNPTTASLNEADTNAASLAFASGVPGSSGFGQNQQLVLRDSEQRQRLQQAADLYEPIAQRESAETLARESQAGEDRRLATSGQQAMERLQLSEAGQTERLTSQQAADARRQILEGDQAMERLNASNAFTSSQQGGELASRERIAQMGISADTARQAISEAGLASRLSSQQASELQQAILRGDQARQLQILQDSGADARQASALANSLQQIRLQGQNQLANTQLSGQQSTINTILAAYLNPNRNTGAGGGTGGGGIPGMRDNPDRFSSSGSTSLAMNGIYNPIPSLATPAPRRSGTPTIDTAAVDRLLAQFGISGGAGTASYYPR